MVRYLKWLGFSALLVLSTVSCSKGGGYVQKVIVQTPWGSAPGQFGLLQEAEGVGPEAMTVDANKHLWILDIVNSRVQEFNFGGQFVRALSIPLRAMDLVVDQKNELILLAPYEAQMVVMNETGNVLRRFSLPPNLELVEGIQLEKNGLAVTTSEQKTVLVLSAEDLTHLKQAPSLMKKNPVPEHGFSSPYSTRRFVTRWLGKTSGEIDILNASGKKINHIQVHPEFELGSIQFLNEDKKKNFYVLEELFPAPRESLFRVIRYSAGGQKIASIDIPNKNIIEVHKPIYVDADGSVYFLSVQPQKFEVVKWEWD